MSRLPDPARHAPAPPAQGKPDEGAPAQMTPPARAAAPAAPARHALASHPLLRWDAIAAHARDHHHAAWPDDTAARTAITGAFDAITPAGCDWDPAAGTITTPPLPAPPAWAPAWEDAQLLNCTIAALAASPPGCDLQDIYDEATYITGNPPGAVGQPGRPRARPAPAPGPLARHPPRRHRASAASPARLAGAPGSLPSE
jgi:hypothetical protein